MGDDAIEFAVEFFTGGGEYTFWTKNHHVRMKDSLQQGCIDYTITRSNEMEAEVKTHCREDGPVTIDPVLY